MFKEIIKEAKKEIAEDEWIYRRSKELNMINHVKRLYENGYVHDKIGGMFAKGNTHITEDEIENLTTYELNRLIKKRGGKKIFTGHRGYSPC